MAERIHQMKIYIPICFYFNTVPELPTLGEIVFTFQYVSILIYFSYTPSIKSCIYIPICFYFNQGGSGAKVALFTFTFQYVSILIREGREQK